MIEQARTLSILWRKPGINYWHTRDGDVYFNFPNINNIPHFTLNGNNNTVVQSADDTCYMIHYDGVLDSSVVIDTTETNRKY